MFSFSLSFPSSGGSVVSRKGHMGQMDAFISVSDLFYFDINLM